MEWNGMEKANKHGTELLSQLGLHPRAYGPQNYTPANCSCCKDQPETKPICLLQLSICKTSSPVASYMAWVSRLIRANFIACIQIPQASILNAFIGFTNTLCIK